MMPALLGSMNDGVWEKAMASEEGGHRGLISECNVKKEKKTWWGGGGGGGGAGHERLEVESLSRPHREGNMERTWGSREPLLQGARLVLTQAALSA